MKTRLLRTPNPEVRLRYQVSPMYPLKMCGRTFSSGQPSNIVDELNMPRALRILATCDQIATGRLD